MNDHEARIDRVLEGLREAEPADALEQRVLRAVGERAAGKTGPQRARFGLSFARSPQGYAVAATVLALALVLGTSALRHRGRQVAGQEGAGRSASAEPASVRDAPSPRSIAATQPERRSPRAAVAERRAKSARAEQHSLLLASGNHPAPEEPLTDQERLLLRLAHRAGPDDLAELNPDARDAQARADSAEFRKFFGPPPTGDSE